MGGITMNKNKVSSIDLDAVAEAERFGALAVGRIRKNRGARMTPSGKTTAQLRVIFSSAQRLFAALRQVASEQPLHIGRATLRLKQHGRDATLSAHGL